MFSAGRSRGCLEASCGASEPASTRPQPDGSRSFNHQALLPIKHGRGPITHGRVPIKHGRFPIKHGRFHFKPMLSRAFISNQWFSRAFNQLLPHLPSPAAPLPCDGTVTVSQLDLHDTAMMGWWRRVGMAQLGECVARTFSQSTWEV